MADNLRVRLRHHVSAILFVTLLAVIACSGSNDNRNATRGLGTVSASFTFVGFSDHAGPDNHAPADVVRPGGTLKSCNPGHLYAFVNFKGLQPPKEFAGNWTLNGAFINGQGFSQTKDAAETFWEVQNTPMPLTPGLYAFQLKVEGRVASEGSLTLTC